MTNYIKRLIIFAEPSHVVKILEYQQPNCETIISFSVDGKIALEKKGLMCLFPDDLIELPDLNRIGLDNLERVKNICNFLDIKLQEKFVFLRENNINLLYAGFFYIKIFFDDLWTSYFILEKMFKEVNADEIIVFKRGYSVDELFEGRSPIIPALVENVFLKKYKNISFISDDRPDFKISMLLKLKHLLRAIRFYFPFKGKNKRYKHNGILLVDMHDTPYLKEILNYVNFYKMYFSNHFIGIRSISSNEFEIKGISKRNKEYDESIKEVFKDVLQSQTYRNMFIEDEDLFLFANKCLESYILKTIGRLLPYADYIRKWLIELSPEVLITAACRLNMEDAFLLELARSLKIPVVTYQEGGGAGYLNCPLFNLDVNLSDYFLVYGKGVMESPFINKGKDNIVPAGSIRLENIRNQFLYRLEDLGLRTNDKGLKTKSSQLSPQSLPPTVYFVLDRIKINTCQHYPYNGGFFSQAYRHQVKIINILKQFKQINVVLKAVEGMEFLYESFVKDNISIETLPLSKILNRPSAFILDYPSTTIQECLLTDKPIALLHIPDNVEFDQNALESLSLRVRVSSDHDKFYKVIEALIDDVKHGTKMTENSEFRDRYCLMNNTESNLKIFFDNLLKNNKEDKC